MQKNISLRCTHEPNIFRTVLDSTHTILQKTFTAKGPWCVLGATAEVTIMWAKRQHIQSCSTFTLDGKVEPDHYSDNTVILVKRGVMEGEEHFLG